MNLERVALLLSSGLKPSAVASIVGCSPARISQLYNQEDFKLLLAEKQAIQDSESNEEKLLADKYHSAEHTLLNQVLDLAPTAELKDVVQALRVVAERQEKFKVRNNPIPAGSLTLNQQIVTISIPSHVLPSPSIILSEDNKIVEVDGRLLAPLSSQGVENLFKQMKGSQNEPARIPASPESSASQALQES